MPVRIPSPQSVFVDFQSLPKKNEIAQLSFSVDAFYRMHINSISIQHLFSEVQLLYLIFSTIHLSHLLLILRRNHLQLPLFVLNEMLFMDQIISSYSSTNEFLIFFSILLWFLRNGLIYEWNSYLEPPLYLHSHSNTHKHGGRCYTRQYLCS